MSSPLCITLKAPYVAVPGREAPERRLDLCLMQGHRTVVVGRSGSGKTLLSRLALGRRPPQPLQTSGRVHVSGSDDDFQVCLTDGKPGAEVEALRRLRGHRLGYVPQGGRENLVPGWSIDRHRQHLGRNRRGFGERVCNYMERLGVDPSAANLAATATGLSEGMIRRVLLALSLAHEPDILVLDEPTTGLDEHSKEALLDLLAEQLSQHHSGLLVNTHDLRVAEKLGQTWMMVERGAFVAETEDLAEAGGPWTSFVHAGRQVGAPA